MDTLTSERQLQLDQLTDEEVLVEMARVRRSESFDPSYFVVLAQRLLANGGDQKPARVEYLRKLSQRKDIDVVMINQLILLRAQGIQETQPEKREAIKKDLQTQLRYALLLGLDQPLMSDTGENTRERSAKYLQALQVALEKETASPSPVTTDESMSSLSTDDRSQSDSASPVTTAPDTSQNRPIRPSRINRRRLVQGVVGATGLAIVSGAGYLASSLPVKKGVETVAENSKQPAEVLKHVVVPPQVKPLSAEALTPRPAPPTALPSSGIEQRKPLVAEANPVATPEVVVHVPVKALARLKNPSPELKDPITGAPLPFEMVKQIAQLGMLDVIGYGKTNEYTFRCYDQILKRYFDIPISQAEIIDGAPISEVPKIPYLGIRNNVPDLMPMVPEFGCSSVRIVSDDNNPREEKNITKALDEGVKTGVDILYTFNPSITPTRETIRDHLEQILLKYKVTLEIGNEPDETTNGYWKDYNKTGGSFESFIQFVKTTIEEARRLRPDIKIIIGASANPLENQQRLIQGLQKVGVDIGKVDFAVHGYGKEELEMRINHVKKVTGKHNLILTELGFDGDTNGMIPSLIKFSRSLGVSDIYLHELPRHQDAWGYVKPDTRQKFPKFYYLQKFVVDQSQSSLNEKTTGNI